MERKNLPDEPIHVKNSLVAVPDNPRAADLFAAILRAVRSATERREQTKREGKLPPAA